MPLLLFLNERSCETEAGPEAVDAAMAEFVRLLRHVRSWRDIALVTRSPLPKTELSQGYYYQQWAGRNRTRHQYLLALRSRSPFRATLPSGPDPQEAEYHHNGETVEGIAIAHLADGLSVSLPLAPQWSASWLHLDIRRLVESETGELVLDEVREAVRHCSDTATADAHETWARESGLASLTAPQHLWQFREEFFPRLQFLPRVERDLRELDLKWFVPVRSLLAALDLSAVGWDPAESLFPQWRAPHITPEAAQRKLLCRFTDFDGEIRVFDLHGRMTPGAGRLHFRLVPEEKALRIAYLGPKR
jgi:hypothetical protein